MKQMGYFSGSGNKVVFGCFFLMALVLFVWLVVPSGGHGGLWMFWGWGVWLGIAAWRKERRDPTPVRPDLGLAGGLILAALTVAGLAAWHEGTGSLSVSWTMFLWWEGFCAWRGSRRLAWRLLLPGLVLTVLVVSQETFYWLLSYPMSRAGTLLAVELMNLSGFSAVGRGTMIYIGSETIAVTTACSGVELLEAMLILGWAIVARTKLPLWLQGLLYGIMLPVIVVLNAVRLSVVTLCYALGGIRAFDEPLHSVFGFAMLLAVIGITGGLGTWFRMLRTPDQKEPPK